MNAAINIRADFLKRRAPVNEPIVSDMGSGTSLTRKWSEVVDIQQPSPP